MLNRNPDMMFHPRLILVVALLSVAFGIGAIYLGCVDNPSILAKGWMILWTTGGAIVFGRESWKMYSINCTLQISRKSHANHKDSPVSVP